MATTGTPQANSEPSQPLNMRIKPAVCDLIDRAAELIGKNRTDFMIEASERRAEEILLDRTVFTVSPETYAAFLAQLDAPTAPHGYKSSRSSSEGTYRSEAESGCEVEAV